MLLLFNILNRINAVINAVINNGIPTLIFILALSLFLQGSCIRATDSEGGTSREGNGGSGFDRLEWSYQESGDYPYREAMLDSVIYSDTTRNLSREQIEQLLGTPDRTNENHFYYTITQKRIGSCPLHTKTMVIKFSRDSIEWIKVHE